MDTRMIDVNKKTNQSNQHQNNEKSKSRMLIILVSTVIAFVIILIIANSLINKDSGLLKNDFSAKSKDFIEVYGNYSYTNPTRNLDSIKELLTESLYNSIQGDETNNKDYVYLSNLNKSKFSIETKITGDSTIQKKSKSYIVKVPVREKSTQNSVSQTENKVYTLTWSKVNNDWKITDFGTNN